MKYLDGIPIFVGGEDDNPSDLEVLNEGSEENKSNEEVVPDEVEPKVETPKVEDEPIIEDEEEPEETKEATEEEDLEKKLKIVTHPTIKEVKAKYPKLFDDFPDIQHSIFRVREFEKIYPTVDDAKEAFNNSEVLEEMTGLITSGEEKDLVSFISNIEEANKGTIKTLASNVLNAIYNVDKDSYFEAVNPVLEEVCRRAYQTGVKNNNDNLKNAAQVLSLFLFEDVDIATGKKTTVRPKEQQSEAQKELQKEKDKLTASKYNEIKNKIFDRCDKVMKKAILDGFSLPESFSGISDDLAERVLTEVDKMIGNDEDHKKLMSSLWGKAFKAGFTGNWEERITVAYLSRAKSVMPAIRAKIRAKALNQKVEDSKNKQAIVEKSNRKELGGSGKIPNSNGKTSIPNPKQIDWNNTSDMDILSDTPTLRK